MGLVTSLRANIGAVIAGIVMGALCIACTVQTIRINGLHWDFKVAGFSLPFLNVDGWKETATKAQDALADVKAAEPKAAAAQIAANHEPAALSARIASASNAQTPSYLANVATVAALHAAPVGGLRCAAAAQGVASPASLPGADRAAQGDDDKAGSSDMVSVARADWVKINAEAALRVQLYQVGQEWIAQGVAVADAAPAKGD